MTPLFNKVFIRPILNEEHTKSGLTVNESLLKKGEVLFPGTGTLVCPITVKKGDIILYAKDCGIKFSDYNGLPGIFLREDEIIAIL